MITDRRDPRAGLLVAGAFAMKVKIVTLRLDHSGFQIPFQIPFRGGGGGGGGGGLYPAHTKNRIEKVLEDNTHK